MDKHTLYDLEIFETDDKNQSLFDRMNHTMSFEGSLALKKKLLQPFGDKTSILQTQDAIRFLMNHLAEYKQNVSVIKIRGIREYIHSNLILSHPYRGLPGTIRAFRLRYKYPDNYYFIKSNIKTLQHFISNMAHWLASQKNLPLTFVELLNVMQEVAVAISAMKIIKKGWRNNNPVLINFEKDRILRCDMLPLLEKLLQLYYEVDAIYAMAMTTIELKLVFPEITDERQPSLIHITGLHHFFLPDGIRNDISVMHENFIFLTGPNMAGKTTFIKALAIIVLLANIGMAVPAGTATIPVFNDVFTCINVRDSIYKGKSYFQQEIIRVGELAGKLQQGQKVFALFDELFRGTNLYDAMDCSQLVIRRFLLWNQSFFLLASHLTELTEEIKNDTGIKFMYFESFIREGNAFFSYHLQEGISYERLGSLLLTNSDIPELLLPHKKNTDNTGA